jgi:HEAT repeat protein
MTRLTARSSTIFIATGDDTFVYRSVDDVPPALRRKLQESTNSMNSATILIADKRGREELVRALEGQSSDVRCRLADTIRGRQAADKPPSTPPRRHILFALRRWLEVLLPATLGASLWFFIDSHF